MTELDYKIRYMFNYFSTTSLVLSSFFLSKELEQRSLESISEMIDSDQHEKIKNYIELFQVELFYSSDLYYDTALLYNQQSNFESALYFYNKLLDVNPIHQAGLFDRAEIFGPAKKVTWLGRIYRPSKITIQTMACGLLHLNRQKSSAYQEKEWYFEKYLMQSLELGMDPYYLTTLGSNWYYWCRHNRLGPSLYASFSDLEQRI